MDLDLFQKAVDEIGLYGVHRLTLHLLGEPLLHPKIFEMVKYAKTKEKIGFVDFSSNGALLNEKRIEGVINSGLDVINVDMDGATAETYENARRGLKFEEVVQNVINLIEAVHASERKKPHIKLQVIQTPAVAAEMDLFWEKWNPVLEGKDCVEVYQKKYEWWSGAKPDDVQSDANWGTPGPLYVRLPCALLHTQMNMFWNGEVNHCCLDTNGDLKIGDFREQSLHEIWHSERAKKLRLLSRDGSYMHIKPCDGCIRSPAKRFFSWNDLTVGPMKRFAGKILRSISGNRS
jgi:radical SAM protein with 4Fe4S-binding SPASM domain